MPSSHSPDSLAVAFDDQHAVANAGLLLTATLGDRLGIQILADQLVDLGRRPGAARPGRKIFGSARRRRRIGDLEGDTDRAGHAPSNLDLVDVCGIRGIGKLERGPAGVEDRDTPTRGARGREGAELGHAKDVTVEPQRVVVILGGDRQPQLDDTDVPVRHARTSVPVGRYVTTLRQSGI
jgi:hypothetical protein